MPTLHVLDDRIWFPPVEEALPDGLLAIGGDLSVARLIVAYKNGIFPWFQEDIPLWWSPNPRFVLFPGKLKVSKSMQQLLKQNKFHFTVNDAFEEVITRCSKAERRGQDGTWITEEMKAAYITLHELDVAISAEAWLDGELVGGLYGIMMGRVFCGESMFASVSNASKYAFIKFVQCLQQEGVEVIDCQVYTEHLESLGAEMIDRESYLRYLPKD